MVKRTGAENKANVIKNKGAFISFESNSFGNERMKKANKQNTVSCLVCAKNARTRAANTQCFHVLYSKANRTSNKERENNKI